LGLGGLVLREARHDELVTPARSPGRIVHATAPIRICDNGGWTDTWFARHGKVFNIGVSPCVEVEIKTFPIGAQAQRVVLDVANYQDRYGFTPGALPGRHPLLEAVIDEMGLPSKTSVEVSVHSEVPAGSSTGTSAAVTVALIGALDGLTPGRLRPDEVAAAAHRIEVDRLGVESGVQDQICAAFGGINYMEVSPYPRAVVTPLQVSADTWKELDDRLVLVYLGQAHVSSELHEQVIAAVTSRQTESEHLLDELRTSAEEARDAVLAADFPALGNAMRRNSDAQACLHPELVGPQARAVFDIAAACGSLGWKVNGAGGDGGSITLLAARGSASRRQLLEALTAADSRLRVIPTSLCRWGLRVW
jgi:D-glycero-alpha-D-manno-heptose-7-phosphate kinase